MRNAFAQEITELAQHDRRILLLSGDIGNRLFDPFKEVAPHQFYNCGVAEANMTGVAAGLALSGLRPITYTITPFNTSRCYEQIKLDICYHNLPVIIVGVGAGLSYASLGATHHSCEDIAIMRALPNMTVICPGDAVEVRLALRAAIRHAGPVYLRIGKKNEPVVHSLEPDLQLGRGIVVTQGKDICLISTGNTLPIAAQIEQELAKQNLSVEIISLHTVKPLDHQLLENRFNAFKLIATLEEHSKIGGLFAAIAEWKAEHACQKTKLIGFNTPDRFLNRLGSHAQARSSIGLDATEISHKLKKEYIALGTWKEKNIHYI